MRNCRWNLSTDDFYKVYAYACLYKVDTENVDSIRMEEITITFFCYHWPRNLIQHLKKERNYNIINVEAGIYHIKGDIISMQLILINELSEEENLWLRGLTDKLPNTGIADKLITDYEQHRDNNLYKSVMDIIVRANKEKFGGNYMCDALMEFFEELYREIKVSKGSSVHNCQNCLRLRTQVALRIVKSAKFVTQNPKTRYAQTDEFWVTTHLCQS